MATKFVQPGSVLDCTAPVGGVVSGMPVLIGDLLVVPLKTAAATVKFAGQVDGVWKIAKPAGAILEGATLYWDNAAAKATGTSTGNRKIGSAAKAAANGDAEVHVRLDGIVAEAATEAAAGAAVAAAVAVTNGGAGNAAKLIKLDGNGKLAGRVIETDGASLDAAVTAIAVLNANTPAGAVLLGDYAAQSVLVAVADDTPAPVTLAAKSVLGRGATGDVAEKLTSVSLDAANPGTAGAETTATAGLAFGRHVYGSLDLTSEVGEAVSCTIGVETAPASGVFKDVQKLAQPAGMAAAFGKAFSFFVPPVCKYKFTKAGGGATAAAFTADGYNFAEF